MAVNVSVVKSGTENSATLIRRFSKRVLGAGIVRRVKGIRYRNRDLSKAKRRMAALRRVERQETRAERERMGLVDPRETRGPRRR